MPGDPSLALLGAALLNQQTQGLAPSGDPTPTVAPTGTPSFGPDEEQLSRLIKMIGAGSTGGPTLFQPITRAQPQQQAQTLGMGQKMLQGLASTPFGRSPVGSILMSLLLPATGTPIPWLQPQGTALQSTLLKLAQEAPLVKARTEAADTRAERNRQAIDLQNKIMGIVGGALGGAPAAGAMPAGGPGGVPGMPTDVMPGSTRRMKPSVSITPAGASLRLTEEDPAVEQERQLRVQRLRQLLTGSTPTQKKPLTMSQLRAAAAAHPEDPEAQAVVQRLYEQEATKLTNTTKVMKEAAPNVLQFADRIDKLIDKNVQQLGPVPGRWAEFMTGRVGETNPDFMALRTNIDLLTTLLMRMHVGARGSEFLMRKFSDMIDAGRQSPENLRAALMVIRQYANDLSGKKVGDPIPSTERNPMPIAPTTPSGQWDVRVVE